MLKRNSTYTAVKMADPYWLGRTHNKFDRALDWLGDYATSVPKAHGPGEGFGYVRREHDYLRKLCRQVADDKMTGTDAKSYLLGLLPYLTQRKFFNELPRPSYYSYGMAYTKQQMFDHVAFGVDPGNVRWEEMKQDPKVQEFVDWHREKIRYYFPEEAPVSTNENHVPAVPQPDDNVYRPIYNRGSNRKLWGRYGH